MLEEETPLGHHDSRFLSWYFGPYAYSCTVNKKWYIYTFFYLHEFKEPTGVFVHQQPKHKIVHFLSDVFFNRPASNRSNSFFKPSTGMEGGSIPNGILLEHSLQRTPRRCGPLGHSNKGGCSSSPKWSEQPTVKTQGAHTSILHRIFILFYLHDYIKPSRDPSIHILPQKLT